MDSILDSVKDKIAGGTMHEHFDNELIDAINLVLMDLRHVGVGPEEGFVITGSDETWKDLLGEDSILLGSVPTLVATKVRLIFDPPANGAITETMNKTIDRAEWRLLVHGDLGI